MRPTSHEQLEMKTRDLEHKLQLATEALLNALETEASRCTKDYKAGKIVHCIVSSLCAGTESHHEECWIGQAETALREIIVEEM